MESCHIASCRSKVTHFSHTDRKLYFSCSSHNQDVPSEARALESALTGQEISLLTDAKAKLLQIISKISEAEDTIFQEHSDHISQTSNALIQSIDECMECQEIVAMLNNDFLLNLYRISDSLKTEIPVQETILSSILKNCSLRDSLICEFIQKIGFKLCEHKKFLYYFKPQTKILYRLNNAKTTNKRFIIDTLPEAIGSFAETCELEDGDIFISDESSKCFKVNPKTLEWQIIPCLPSKTIPLPPLEVNNISYIFEDMTKSYYTTNRAIKFHASDCTENDDDEYLPADERIYCVKGIDCVFISAASTHGIFRYSYTECNYEKIFYKNNSNSVLLKDDNGKLFYLSERIIYESSIFNCKEWKEIGEYYGILANPVNTPQFYDGSFYFSMTNGNFKFDTKDLTLEKLRLNII